LRDAQQLQFELAPPAVRRELARGGGSNANDQINASSPGFALRPGQRSRCGALALEATSRRSPKRAGNHVEQGLIERARKQQLLIMVLLVIVSAVIIA